MADVLMLRREHRPTRIELAVRGALAGGAHAGRAVGFLACQAARPPAAVLEVLPGHLEAIEPPDPTLDDYDRLLARGDRR